jgi:hypothetical protein
MALYFEKKGTGIDTVDLAYGVFITLSERNFDELDRMDAKKKVDIAVKYKDETKEFTFQEFMGLLGFKVR